MDRQQILNLIFIMSVQTHSERNSEINEAKSNRKVMLGLIILFMELAFYLKFGKKFFRFCLNFLFWQAMPKEFTCYHEWTSPNFVVCSL